MKFNFPPGPWKKDNFGIVRDKFKHFVANLNSPDSGEVIRTEQEIEAAGKAIATTPLAIETLFNISLRTSTLLQRIEDKQVEDPQKEMEDLLTAISAEALEVIIQANGKKPAVEKQ